MADQLDLFAGTSRFPDGFKFARDVLAPDAEASLLSAIRELPFREFDFHGYVGKRRTVSFGWRYDFSEEKLRPAEAIPDFLFPARNAAAAFGGVAPDQLQQVLVTEYGPGAGIGWHRDKGVFGDVIGLSLLSSCQFRLRRQVGEKWQRVKVEAEPRSAYLLRGPARTEWEHSIPAVETTRYSITLRTLRSASRGPA